jgi:hypothetical protein
MTYTDDSDLPAITDDQLREALTEIRPYTIVILKAGPKFEMPDADHSSDVAKLIWAHGRRNYALLTAVSCLSSVQ